MTYLSRSELQSVLNNNFFKTDSVHLNKYALYRGKTEAKVLTLRFNLNTAFDEDMVVNKILSHIVEHFPSQRSLLALIEYDLVLMRHEPESYYIWRANSNTSTVPYEERKLNVTFDDIFMFCRQSMRVNPSDLDVYFRNSSVVIHSIIAVVYTFIST